MYLQQALSPELSPASFERPIDLVHLARQTLGDRELEREIINLFVVQARSCLLRIATAEAIQERIDLAHTLKGSARAVGAWHVADAAEACELIYEFSGKEWEDAYRKIAHSVRSVIEAVSALHNTH